MAIFVVIGIRQENGEIESASLVPVDGATLRSGVPYEYSAKEVADMIRKGNVVQAQFIVKHAQTVPGPLFKVVTRRDGTEGVEMEPDAHGRTVQDLVQDVKVWE